MTSTSSDGGVRAAAEPQTAVQAAVAEQPRRIHLPYYRWRSYTRARTKQLQQENRALGLPFFGGFVQSMLELEAEAERQSLIYASKSRLYASLYYIFGLPAAILAAIAGATALASTTGRLAAGIIALASSALSAAVVFLDSGKQRDMAAKVRVYWDDLYSEIHAARLTELADYTVSSGKAALNLFYVKTSSIRAGRNPEDDAQRMQSGQTTLFREPEYLFPEAHRQRQLSMSLHPPLGPENSVVFAEPPIEGSDTSA